MPKYAFIPGSHPALSLAELRAQKVGNPALITKDFFVIEAHMLDAVSLQFRLGGTVKIAEIIEISGSEVLSRVFDINNLLSSYFAQSEDKIVFGVSIYGNVPRSLLASMRRAGFEAKKNLARAQYSARFLFDPSGVLKGAAVAKNHVIDRGAEIVVIAQGKKLLIGKTLTIQDFESYSERDYGRPVRDTKSGTLPPKLAQIMINLAGQSSSATLLDPFCGSGTILQEALRMGYRNVIGSDISEKAVKNTKQNLEWYQKSSGLPINPHIVQKDVKGIGDVVAEKSIDAIIAEVYLGPPLTRIPEAQRLEKMVLELVELYRDALRSLAHIIKPEGVAVLAIPFFRTRGRAIFIPIHEITQATGWKRISPLQAREYQLLQNDHPDRGLLYFRSDQFVGREIVKLTPVR